MADLNQLAVFKKAGSAAVVRPLGALAQMLTRLQGSLYQAPSNIIPGMKPTDFPSPLQPVAPFGPPDAQPLGLNMQMGQNLIFTPRPDSRYTAADLQALARYPLARLCITNVIDTISSLKWKIQLKAQPGEDRKEREERQLKDDTIRKLTEFMESPDGEHNFSDWIRPFLNDMLTVDAGCYLLRKTPDGTVYEWRVLQGAYIVRYVDANGYTPRAPAPAYSQLWDGIPRVFLNADQLIYRPRNIVYEIGNVASSLYGQSPTEALAPELEVGIQRLRYVTNFYKDGSIPNVLWVVPSDASPDVVKTAMDYLNSDMSGNLEARRMFRFAQGFRSSESAKEDQIKQFEEPKLSDEFDDLHIKRVCFGYGVSAQRMTRPMNRASAQTNQEAAEEEGIAPFRRWVESSINHGLQARMGFQKYEFGFDVSTDPDPTKQAEIDQQDLDGKMTLNEVRVRAGLDEIDSPNANKVGKWLTTGWASIDDAPALPTPKEPAPRGNGEPPNPEDEPPAPKGKQKVRKADDTAVLNPGRDTIRARQAKSQLFVRVWHFFYQIKSTMVIVDPHTHKMAKAENEPDVIQQQQIEQIVDAIMGSIQWNALPLEVQPAIQDAALEGASIGLDQAERAVQTGPLTVTLSPQPVRVIASATISDVNQVAMDYAQNRGAELVGMKWVDGKLVQNPNASMAITDSTRNMLREILNDAFSHETPMSELVQKIRDAGVFSEQRAKLIASTEVKFAQARGNIEAWKKSGVVKEVEWVLSADHTEDDECDDNADAGPVAVGEAFPSGDVAPPEHPNCWCSLSIATLNPPKKVNS